MVRATRTRTIDGQSSTETAYYLSSLEANASRLAKAIKRSGAAPFVSRQAHDFRG
jgi:hypothetical protein